MEHALTKCLIFVGKNKERGDEEVNRDGGCGGRRVRPVKSEKPVGGPGRNRRRRPRGRGPGGVFVGEYIKKRLKRASPVIFLLTWRAFLCNIGEGLNTRYIT